MYWSIYIYSIGLCAQLWKNKTKISGEMNDYEIINAHYVV